MRAPDVIKLVHVITGLNTGGTEMMLYKLLSVLDRGRCQNEVISLTDVGAVGERIGRLHVPVRALEMRRGRPGISALVRLSSWLRQSAPDVVQTWMYHADLAGGLAAKLAGRIPVVWGVHNGLLEPKSSKRLTIWTAKTCARLSRVLPKTIVCVSETARQFHTGMGYAADKFVVIPNGFDLALFKPDPLARISVRQELGLSPSAVLVGLIARFDPQKDHRSFVQAAAMVANRQPDAHFVLCGEGVTSDNRELHQWIVTAGLSGGIHLLGRRDDIPRLTAALDLAVNSSFGESSPNAVGEAMACGVPCVVTDAGDSAMMVGATGKVAPVRSPERLAEAILEMIDSGPAALTGLGAAARKRVESEFDIGAVAGRYTELYSRIAEGN